MSEYEQGRFAVPRDDDPRADDPSGEEPSADSTSSDDPVAAEAGAEDAGESDEGGGYAAEEVAAPAALEETMHAEAAAPAEVEEAEPVAEAPPAVEPAHEEAGAESPGEDPFEGWPQAQSAAVIEDPPEEGVSVEHVSGEIDVPDGYTVFEGTPTGHRRTVAIVVSRFNGGLTNQMLSLALDTLEEAGVEAEGITVMPVPGAFELPLAAMALAKTRRYACVIALGAIVRGETPHFEYIAGEVASGLQLAAIETGIPVSFGVLTVDSVEQGEARIFRAADAVRTALEMADVFAQLRASARPV